MCDTLATPKSLAKPNYQQNARNDKRIHVSTERMEAESLIGSERLSCYRRLVLETTPVSECAK